MLACAKGEGGSSMKESKDAFIEQLEMGTTWTREKRVEALSDCIVL